MKKSSFVEILNDSLNLSISELDLIKKEVDLNFVPDHYEHSWAGEYGHLAYLIQDDEPIPLNSEGSYSDNGRITAEREAEPIGLQLARKNVKAGDIVFFHAFYDYSKEYRKPQFTYAVITDKEVVEAQKRLSDVQNEEL